MKLFECAIRYDKTLDNGLQKKITEYYLVDALSFTEAETRITKQMQDFTGGEFEVVAEKITRYSEYLPAAAAGEDKVYKAKINLIALDERSGREKKTPLYMAIWASGVDNAHGKIVRHFSGTVVDYEIASIDETPVMDVFLYQPA